MTDRRNFLRGMLALGAAPAIVRASSLMPIWVPPAPSLLTLAGDGVTDDTAALHAYMRGEPVWFRGAVLQTIDNVMRLPAATFNLNSPLILTGSNRFLDGGGATLLAPSDGPAIRAVGEMSNCVVQNLRCIGKAMP